MSDLAIWGGVLVVLFIVEVFSEVVERRRAMAKGKKIDGGTAFIAGRRHARFQSLISPLGRDPDQTADYSPSRPVEERQAKGRSGQSEHARNERRGG